MWVWSIPQYGEGHTADQKVQSHKPLRRLIEGSAGQIPGGLCSNQEKRAKKAKPTQKTPGIDKFRWEGIEIARKKVMGIRRREAGDL